MQERRFGVSISYSGSSTYSGVCSKNNLNKMKITKHAMSSYYCYDLPTVAGSVRMGDSKLSEFSKPISLRYYLLRLLVSITADMRNTGGGIESGTANSYGADLILGGYTIGVFADGAVHMWGGEYCWRGWCSHH